MTLLQAQLLLFPRRLACAVDGDCRQFFRLAHGGNDTSRYAPNRLECICIWYCVRARVPGSQSRLSSVLARRAGLGHSSGHFWAICLCWAKGCRPDEATGQNSSLSSSNWPLCEPMARIHPWAVPTTPKHGLLQSCRRGRGAAGFEKFSRNLLEIARPRSVGLPQAGLASLGPIRVANPLSLTPAEHSARLIHPSRVADGNALAIGLPITSPHTEQTRHQVCLQ